MSSIDFASFNPNQQITLDQASGNLSAAAGKTRATGKLAWLSRAIDWITRSKAEATAFDNAKAEFVSRVKAEYGQGIGSEIERRMNNRLGQGSPLTGYRAQQLLSTAQTLKANQHSRATDFLNSETGQSAIRSEICQRLTPTYFEAFPGMLDDQRIERIQSDVTRALAGRIDEDPTLDPSAYEVFHQRMREAVSNAIVPENQAHAVISGTIQGGQIPLELGRLSEREGDILLRATVERGQQGGKFDRDAVSRNSGHFVEVFHAVRQEIEKQFPEASPQERAQLLESVFDDTMARRVPDKLFGNEAFQTRIRQEVQQTHELLQALDKKGLTPDKGEPRDHARMTRMLLRIRQDPFAGNPDPAQLAEFASTAREALISQHSMGRTAGYSGWPRALRSDTFGLFKKASELERPEMLERVNSGLRAFVVESMGGEATADPPTWKRDLDLNEVLDLHAQGKTKDDIDGIRNLLRQLDTFHSTALTPKNMLPILGQLQSMKEQLATYRQNVPGHSSAGRALGMLDSQLNRIESGIGGQLQMVKSEFGDLLPGTTAEGWQATKDLGILMHTLMQEGTMNADGGLERPLSPNQRNQLASLNEAFQKAATQVEKTDRETRLWNVQHRDQPRPVPGPALGGILGALSASAETVQIMDRALALVEDVRTSETGKLREDERGPAIELLGQLDDIATRSNPSLLGLQASLNHARNALRDVLHTTRELDPKDTAALRTTMRNLQLVHDESPSMEPSSREEARRASSETLNGIRTRVERETRSLVEKLASPELTQLVKDLRSCLPGNPEQPVDVQKLRSLMTPANRVLFDAYLRDTYKLNDAIYLAAQTDRTVSVWDRKALPKELVNDRDSRKPMPLGGVGTDEFFDETEAFGKRLGEKFNADAKTAYENLVGLDGILYDLDRRLGSSDDFPLESSFVRSLRGNTTTSDGAEFSSAITHLHLLRGGD